MGSFLVINVIFRSLKILRILFLQKQMAVTSATHTRNADTAIN